MSLRWQCRWRGSCAVSSLLVVVLLWVSGCASTSRINDRFADDHGWEQHAIKGTVFTHRVYFSPGDGAGVLHVYIDGDGRPWLRPTVINLRPEVPRPLMLQAMALDEHPALYLTRPCYHQQFDADKCDPWYWTYGRYAPEVVESLAAVVQRWVDSHGHATVRVYGHSGGGSIAMLMARHLADVDGIVTVAANLDTAAWTRFHGYTALVGSLNPVVSALPLGVAQFHYLGGEDNNVPPGIFPAIESRSNIAVRIVPAQGHRCCWLADWPTILEETDLFIMQKKR